MYYNRIGIALTYQSKTSEYARRMVELGLIPALNAEACDLTLHNICLADGYC